MKKRLLCLFLTLALLLTVLLPAIPAAQAAKQEKTRAIGIVFDNSGSMYTGSNVKAWCRATYATEVFASMMNEGDQLILYPMNPIKLGKHGTTEYTMNSPLVINGPNEAETIRQITPSNEQNGTPFAAVEAAHAGMLNVQADEKYLIVLTDGAFENGYKPMSEVNEALDLYSRDMNVMFLGLGIDDDHFPTKSDPSRQHYVAANSTALVLTELTAMCNRIFGRDELSISGNAVDFDVSMSKLIVFVQGENISDVTLGGKKPVSQHTPKYSELGREKPAYAWQVDTSLQGVIATFENLDAGSYELSYTGDADSTSIYYEPDVDLALQLTDATGAPVGKDVYPGTYTLSYALVDKHGNPTTSKLLKDVSYIIQGQAGEPYSKEDTQPGSLELILEAGDTLTGDYTVRYLGDYTIHKDLSALGLPAGGIDITPRPVGQVTAKVEGGKDVYPLSQLEELAVYEVSVFCEGEPITGEDLDRVDLKVTLDGGNAVPEVQQTDKGFTVTLKYNGSAADTKCGIQSASFHVTYTNKDGETGKADPVVREFEIQDDSSALAVEIQLEQSYYVISKLEEAAPIRFRLTADGAPLSAEQFAATSLSVDMGGLVFDLQPDPQSSSYVAKLQPGQTIKDGKYTVSCQADGFDEIGRPVSATDSVKIDCRSYPIWVPWLIAALITLGLLTIVWIFLNSKVLPKKVTIERCSFLVGTTEVNGDADCVFIGGGKKQGFLEISPPYFAGAPAASSCGINLELVAVSPRKTPSAKRYIGVRGASAGNELYTTQMRFGGTTLNKNEDGIFVRGNSSDTTVEEDIDSGATIRVYADIPGAYNYPTSVALEVRLQFY